MERVDRQPEVGENLWHGDHDGEVRDEVHSEHLLVDAGRGQQLGRGVQTDEHAGHACRRHTEKLMGVALELEFHFI